jgi:hypothetical protein
MIIEEFFAAEEESSAQPSMRINRGKGYAWFFSTRGEKRFTIASL